MDLSNKKFGKWLVLELDYEKSGRQKYWKCVCDCGCKRSVYQSALVHKKSVSCGCYQKEVTRNRLTTHNLTGSRLMKIFYNMRTRCNNSKDRRFKDYGGRGIKLCKEWENNFLNFYNWAVNNGYKDGLTIDRIDNDSNYSPENCRWITLEEQSNNKRNSIFITINDITKTLKQWTKFMDWKYNKYYARYMRNKIVFNKYDINQILIKLKGENLCQNVKILAPCVET